VTTPSFPAITIRPAYADDALAIARLAALDCAGIPRGPLVVAEVDGELRAAMSISDFTAIADPFHRTLELVALLRDHVNRTHPASLTRDRRMGPAALLRRGERNGIIARRGSRDPVGRWRPRDARSAPLR